MRTHPVHLETPAPLIAAFDLVRVVVSARLGVLRDAGGLHSAISALLPLLDAERKAAGPATVAMLIAVFAMLRLETRGAHARSDFPKRLPDARRRKMTLSEALAFARSHASFPIMRSA